MDESSIVRLHAFVGGMVQGVGFRYFVLDVASGLGSRGWVRNLRDGRVEVVAEGRRASLETLLQQLREGPRAARVDRVDADWEVATGEYSRFGLERTA
jgi:acylphosphatase